MRTPPPTPPTPTSTTSGAKGKVQGVLKPAKALDGEVGDVYLTPTMGPPDYLPRNVLRTAKGEAVPPFILKAGLLALVAGAYKETWAQIVGPQALLPGLDQVETSKPQTSKAENQQETSEPETSRPEHVPDWHTYTSEDKTKTVKLDVNLPLFEQAVEVKDALAVVEKLEGYGLFYEDATSLSIPGHAGCLGHKAPFLDKAYWLNYYFGPLVLKPNKRSSPKGVKGQPRACSEPLNCLIEIGRGLSNKVGYALRGGRRITKPGTKVDFSSSLAAWVALKCVAKADALLKELNAERRKENLKELTVLPQDAFNTWRSERDEIIQNLQDFTKKVDFTLLKRAAALWETWFKGKRLVLDDAKNKDLRDVMDAICWDWMQKMQTLAREAKPQEGKPDLKPKADPELGLQPGPQPCPEPAEHKPRVTSRGLARLKAGVSLGEPKPTRPTSKGLGPVKSAKPQKVGKAVAKREWETGDPNDYRDNDRACKLWLEELTPEEQDEAKRLHKANPLPSDYDKLSCREQILWQCGRYFFSPGDSSDKVKARIAKNSHATV